MEQNAQIETYQKKEMVLSKDNVMEQINLIQDLMKNVMKEGEHYGTIPGCGDKNTLLKPGAEKLGLTFRLSPTYRVERINHEDGHREYEIICTLTHILTNQIWGQGVGTCSTLESKYQFRWEKTSKSIPKEYWDSRDVNDLGGSQYAPRKSNGTWVIFEKIKHDNPADYYNTCLKIGKKRAQVDAVITATAAGDIFTQDIEDIVDNEKAATGKDNVVIDVKNEYSGKEPPEKNSQGDGQKYPPKEAPTSEMLIDFQNEMLFHLKTMPKVKGWLKKVTDFYVDKETGEKGIDDLKRVTSTIWLGKLKGDFRKEFGEMEKQKPLPEVDINQE